MEREFLLSQGDLRINGVLSHPDYGEVQRVVLGVHGLGGSANDEIQTGIAEEMGLFGAAMLRFDFPAHGNSVMDSNMLTLANCVDTLLAVAGYAKQQYPQVENLCIFATGFGAYVTLIALQDLLELPGQVRLVIQTPSVRMHETLLAMKGISRETFWALDRITFPAPRPFEVTYSFYEELEQNIAITTYPIPMLILHGEADSFIRMRDIQQFHRINEQSKLVIIPGTSHRFLEEGAWDRVLDLTRDWFEFEQVLLSDWE
ncbi:MAG: alpha/beta hydrolase [Faecousia sp.]